jgi:hypothetical protein
MMIYKSLAQGMVVLSTGNEGISPLKEVKAEQQPHQHGAGKAAYPFS